MELETPSKFWWADTSFTGGRRRLGSREGRRTGVAFRYGERSWLNGSILGLAGVRLKEQSPGHCLRQMGGFRGMLLQPIEFILKAKCQASKNRHLVATGNVDLPVLYDAP